MRVDGTLRAAAAQHPARTALVTDGKRVSYQELWRAVEWAGAALQRRGVEPGDRIVLTCDNGLDLVVALYGALAAGAVVCPVNASAKHERIASIAAHCGASGVIAGERQMVAAADAKQLHPASGWWIEPVAAVARCENGRLKQRDVIDSDPAMIVYTSGSTGLPKGVVWSHRNIVAATDSINGYLKNTPDDRILNVLPLSFGYGLTQLFLAFHVGASVLLERSMGFPYALLERMRTEGATAFPLVPTIAAILLEMRGLQPESVPALRYMTNAAAPLPAAHQARLLDLFRGTRFFSMYGQTECIRGTYMPPDQLPARPGSVGVAIPNTQAYVVDDAGERAGPDVVGELVIRGPHVMQGYWSDPIGTSEKLRPGPYPWERVLHTGDLFRMDAAGYLYFVSRKDDIIKTRGEKVSPKEVEAVLYRLEGVREAVVLGVPDPVLGQAVHCAVVLAEGSTVTEGEILRHCGAHLEEFMVPRKVELRESLPKTDSGKIRRVLEPVESAG
jgi:amino acid adenylation domain-containing protein